MNLNLLYNVQDAISLVRFVWVGFIWKTFQNIVWRKICDTLGVSKIVQTDVLFINNLFHPNRWISFRQPHPNLDQKVHLKHQPIILRRENNWQMFSTFVSRDTELGGPRSPPPLLFQRAWPVGPPFHDFSEHAPCRTWYIYYDRGTRMY